jgi:predicted SAM-dependent methyltransferase
MSPKGETDLCRGRLLKYCAGQGVDLGCGNVKIKPDAIGIDLYHPNADMHEDVRDLSCYPKGHFDYVYSSHMLEELENTEATLREWLRILKPGGYLVLYQADRDLYYPLGDPRCNSNHKHHFKWGELWAILEKIGNTELVQHAVYSEEPYKEWSFELVVRKAAPNQPKIETKSEPKTLEGISFLIPTLNRPKNIEDFTLSVDRMTTNPQNIEIVFGIHEEDTASKAKIEEMKSKVKIEIRAELINRYSDGKCHLTFLWNQLYVKSKYPIVGYFGDDVIFQTPGWDEEVRKEFTKDKAILFYANDVYVQKGALATLFFTHKAIHEKTGYYLNEHFRRWYMDTWWDSLFRNAGKTVYKPDIHWAHIHPDAFPEKLDATYRAMETDNYKVADGRYWSSPENVAEMQRVINIIKEYK